MKIAFIGDEHYDAKNQGKHLDYPAETILNGDKINAVLEEEKPDVIVMAGDFAQSNFKLLKYRNEVERIVNRRKEIANGHLYCLRGNHDTSSKDLCEYDYFGTHGFFKMASTVDENGLIFKQEGTDEFIQLALRDYGDTRPIDVKPGATLIIAAHGWFIHESQEEVGNLHYGKPIPISQIGGWDEAALMICGHIHTELMQQKKTKNNMVVHYLPCINRLAVSEYVPNRDACVDIVELTSDGHLSLDRKGIPFPEFNESFNQAMIEEEDVKAGLAMYEKAYNDSLTSDLYSVAGEEMDKNMVALAALADMSIESAVEYVQETDEVKKLAISLVQLAN